jgi:ankyrin repeat protein
VSRLLEALYAGEDEHVAELLAAGPELDVFEAAAFGRAERLRELLDEDAARANAFGEDGFQPLGLACFFGHLAAARLLLERGANPKTLARNEHIQTNALHAAAAAENKTRPRATSSSELLLDHGADADIAQGGNEFRAIDAARANGDERLERLLLER